MKRIMWRHRILFGGLAAAVAVAGLLAFTQKGFTQQDANAPAKAPAAAAVLVPAPLAPVAAGPRETVIVTPPPQQRVFDMRQCIDDGKVCQMATCVSESRPDGALYVCQSHGNFFP